MTSTLWNPLELLMYLKELIDAGLGPQYPPDGVFMGYTASPEYTQAETEFWKIMSEAGSIQKQRAQKFFEEHSQTFPWESLETENFLLN